jgi:hypothetical protein
LTRRKKGAVIDSPSQVYGWKEGDKIILACYFYNSGPVKALCYSSTSPGLGRVSEQIGSLSSKSKVTTTRKWHARSA